jgi:tetratricopeptide (TPR) repeat protein
MCNYDQAFQHLDSSEKNLPARPGNLATKINSTRSAIHYRKGEYTDSIEYANQALAISKKLKSKRDTAYAYNMLANSYTATGNYHDAILNLESAVEIYDELEDYPGLAITYQNMGNGYGFLGEFERAEEFYNKSLEINKNLHNSSSVLIIHYCLGDICLYKQELDDAFRHFDYVIKRSQDADVRKDLVGVTLYKISMVYFHKDNLDKCEEYIQESLSVLSETQATNFIVEAKLMLAELRYDQNRFDESILICDEILSLASSLGNNLYVLNALKISADSYAQTDNYQMAHKMYNEYLSYNDDLDSNYDAAVIILRKAKLPAASDEDADSICNMLEIAINTFSALSDKNNLKEAQALLAKLGEQ